MVGTSLARPAPGHQPQVVRAATGDSTVGQPLTYGTVITCECGWGWSTNKQVTLGGYEAAATMYRRHLQDAPSR